MNKKETAFLLFQKQGSGVPEMLALLLIAGSERKNFIAFLIVK